MIAVTLALVAYLIGSISFAVIVSRVFGLPDPRTYGSGNPGASNVLRSGRKAAAALTLIGDSVKGWLAVFIAERFAGPGPVEVTMALAAVAVVVGHMYPLFFRFQGGKGVSTALGVLVALNYFLAGGAVATWIIVAASSRISSLAGLVSAVFVPFFALILFSLDHPYFWSMVVIAALLFWRHKTNIQNLIAGKEGRIGSQETGVRIQDSEKSAGG